MAYSNELGFSYPLDRHYVASYLFFGRFDFLCQGICESANVCKVERSVESKNADV